jgi:hypothetical protein
MNIWENFNFDNPQKTTTTEMTKQDKMSIKDFYNKLHEYFEDINTLQNHIKLSIITDKLEYSGEVRDFQDIYHWYRRVSKMTKEEKEILFGDKKLQISEISQIMSSILKEKEIEYGEDYNEEDDEEYFGPYDSCVHASAALTLQLVSDVYNFFLHLDEDRLIAVATGAVESDYEIDIDGGRSYFMNKTNIYLYCFNYLHYTMGVDAHKYDDMIYNSGSASEHISDFYLNTNYELPSIEKLENWYHIRFKKKYEETFNSYNSMLSNIIKQFGGNPLLDDMISKLNDCVATNDYIEAKVREIKLDNLGI